MSLPAIVVPDDHCAAVQEIFRPLDRAIVPELAAVIDWLQVHDPDVLAATKRAGRAVV